MIFVDFNLIVYGFQYYLIWISCGFKYDCIWIFVILCGLQLQYDLYGFQYDFNVHFNDFDCGYGRETVHLVSSHTDY